MSLFDGGKRLPPERFSLDLEGLRRGFYTDSYFVNIARLLTELSKWGYRYARRYPYPSVCRPHELLIPASTVIRCR